MKITKTQLKKLIREELAEYSRPGRLVKEVSRGMPNMKEWWNEDPKDVMSFVYWLKGQLPPAGEDWDAAWESLKQQLEKRHPSRGRVETSVDKWHSGIE
tara:strand:- start:112 stop:408 length:297 start_codon:yes stop_codon:yes gene_type:complete